MKGAILLLLFISYIRKMKIAIINGPNLNLLGKREVGIYGTESFENYFNSLQLKYPLVEFSYFQSNIEGEIVSELQG